MIGARFARVLALGAAFGVAAGCASVTPIKPAEALDERTGVTVGSLQKPIELLQEPQEIATPDRRVSFAYLGPIEWDNMGTISYALWIHLAPGDDWRFDDIKTPSAVTLSLDDGSVPMSLMDAPTFARGPYRSVASWGQSGYFNLDLGLLRRMAMSDRIGLDLRAGDALIHFSAPRNARTLLQQYLHARGY
jgi:hypothetical protein